MTEMDTKSRATSILEAIKKAGINLVTSLPDINCLELINALEQDTVISFTYLCVAKKKESVFAPGLDWSERSQQS